MPDLTSYQAMNVTACLAILARQLQWLLLLANASPGLPTGGLAPIVRDEHEFWALAWGDKPTMAQADPALSEVEALRAVLAQAKQDLNKLRDLYTGAVVGLHGEAQKRAQECIDLIDAVLWQVDATEAFMP